MIDYVKCFDSNKTMSFKVTDNNLLKSILKYGKNSSLMDIEFDSEPVYGDNDKYIKKKIYNQVHLMMKLKMTLIVSLIMNLIMNNLLMNHIIETIFW